MIGGRWIGRGFLNSDTPSLHGRALARSLPICYRVTWKKGPSDSYALAVAAAATISIYAKKELSWEYRSTAIFGIGSTDVLYPFADFAYLDESKKLHILSQKKRK
jgi:hypothetical protein